MAVKYAANRALVNSSCTAAQFLTLCKELVVPRPSYWANGKSVNCDKRCLLMARILWCRFKSTIVNTQGAMMIWKLLSIGLSAVCFQISASAATFTSKCDAQFERFAGCTIIMIGEIVKGDNERLIDLLRTSRNSGSSFYRTILLQSMGGSISEALLIAQTVTLNVLDTKTTAHWRNEYPLLESYCVSACFLIWVAGAERLHFSSPSLFGKRPVGLGLHRPYFSKDDFASLDPLSAAKSQQDLVEKVRVYLKRNDVPDKLIDEMIKRSSKEVYWLDTLEGSDDLDQRAPWFEELMISKCSFDPEFDRQVNSFGASETLTGKKIPKDQKDKYFAWRRNYNSCEYEFRKTSQTKFISAK